MDLKYLPWCTTSSDLNTISHLGGEIEKDQRTTYEIYSGADDIHAVRMNNNTRSYVLSFIPTACIERTPKNVAGVIAARGSYTTINHVLLNIYHYILLSASLLQGQCIFSTVIRREYS